MDSRIAWRTPGENEEGRRLQKGPGQEWPSALVSAMTAGANHSGTIYRGDLDMWTFDAAKNDAISLSIGEVLLGETDPGFFPWIRLRGPDGAQIGNSSGALVGQINVTAPLTGTYTVLVASADTGNQNAGHVHRA